MKHYTIRQPLVPAKTPNINPEEDRIPIHQAH